MDQQITTIPLKVPCFLVKTGAGFLLIDTGDSSDRIELVKVLDREKVKPENLKLILLTHGDFDHSGNAAFLRQTYAAKVAMHAGDIEMVKRGDMSCNRKPKSDRFTIFGKTIQFISRNFIKLSPFDPFTPDLIVDDGYDLSAYGFDAKVLHLPGHSKGSIGILTSAGDLFCGDLLMNMITPDLHFLIDDISDCDHSIKKIKNLPVHTVYPGHGKPFPIERFWERGISR